MPLPQRRARSQRDAHGWNRSGKRKASKGFEEPFSEEVRILEGFAAARDDATFGVLTLRDDVPGDDLERLETAVEGYQSRVARLGAARVLEAAREARRHAIPTHKGFYGYSGSFRKALGEGKELAAEWAQPERSKRVEETSRRIVGQFTGLPYESPLFDHYRHEGMKPDQARKEVYALRDRTQAAFLEATAAFGRYDQGNSKEDLDAAIDARAKVYEAIEFAQQCVRDTYRENAELWIGGDGDLFTGVKAVFALFRGGVESVEEP